MIKMLKWEIMKWYYLARWIVASAIGVTGVFALLTMLGAFANIDVYREVMLTIFSVIFSALIIMFCVIGPSENMLIDFMFPYKYLEITAKKNFSQMILAKLIINAILFSIGVVIEDIANFIYKYFIPSSKVYFSISKDKGGDIMFFLILGVIIPIMLLFFYMLTYCIKTEIKHRILLMIVIMSFVFGAAYLLGSMPVIGGTYYNYISFIIIIIISDIAVGGLHYIYKNKYEPRQ